MKVLSIAEVVGLYKQEMTNRGVDIGDPLEELDQRDWDALYALYLRGAKDRRN